MKKKLTPEEQLKAIKKILPPKKSRKALDRVLIFGKYAGIALEDIAATKTGRDYLRWLGKQSNVSLSIKEDIAEVIG